jgi:hypothetical protein
MATVKQCLEVDLCHQECNKDCPWAEPKPSDWEIGNWCPMAQTRCPSTFTLLLLQISI